MTGVLRYFAYGSNMSRTQMSDRCPGAVNPIEAVLADHTWICNERGVATVVPVVGRTVHGVVWEVSDRHIADLDGYEGVHRDLYRREVVSVQEVATGDVVDATIYIANQVEPGPPRPDYLDTVIDGATQHRLPEWWLTYLRGWRRAGPRSVTGDSRSAPRSLTELLRIPGVTESVELGTRVGFMAIHGGLEAMTDVIVDEVARASGASRYTVLHPSDLDHHLPSIRYHPAESERLSAFLDHIDVVVSVHGYGRRGRWTDVMAGGRNRDLARQVAAVLHRHLDGFAVITDLDQIPKELRGQHRANPVNLPRRGGVQLELPPRLRGLSPLSPPPGPDGFSPPTRALIDGLSEVARTAGHTARR